MTYFGILSDECYINEIYVCVIKVCENRNVQLVVFSLNIHVMFVSKGQKFVVKAIKGVL